MAGRLAGQNVDGFLRDPVRWRRARAGIARLRPRRSHRHRAERRLKICETKIAMQAFSGEQLQNAGISHHHRHHTARAQSQRRRAKLAEPAHRHPRRRHERVLWERAVVRRHVHGRSDDELVLHEHARALRHGASGSVARSAEQSVRPQHHRRRRQLHHPPAAGGRRQI